MSCYLAFPCYFKFLFQLLQNNINNYKIIVCLVRIYISSKKFSKAREMLSKLKELNAPEHEVVLLNICMLIKKKMLNEAAQLAEKNNLENFDYYIATGKLYWDLEQFDKSLAAFLKVSRNENEFFSRHLIFRPQK